jgi:hypothetical protein
VLSFIASFRKVYLLHGGHSVLLKTILRNSLIISTVLFTLFLTNVNSRSETYAQTNVNQTNVNQTNVNQTNVNQTNVKSFKFLTVFINLTKDGSVQQFDSSQKTITGTDAQLKTAFAALVKQQNYQNKNVVSTTFINDDNKTQEVYSKGQATPAVFDKWFNTMLTATHGITPAKKIRVWITVCSVDKCGTTHGTLWQ